MKKIPIGVEDFKKIIEENYYYVDKTKFIEDILNDGAQVKLFTRPRRFGKTLNMSTLKYFFDVRNAEKNRELFKNLYIENSPVFSEQGKYPVIFISMKGIADNNFEESLKKIREKISALFDEHKDILNILDEFDSQKFRDYINGNIDKAKLENSLVFLTKILTNYYNQPVILLIDEYDSIIINAYENGYYREMINFLKGFYGDVLKTNNYLKMGILTGIIRIAQAGIFSDLNNLKVNTILDKAYEESFGLTEKEVETLLKEYGIEYKIEDVKLWYDGYKFGNAEVYNPWSIINYLDRKELAGYWIDTSGNYLIKDILKRADEETFEKLNALLRGEDIEEEIAGMSTLQEILEADDLWELLLFSGYLTIKEKTDKNTYFIKIPNYEVKEFFGKSFIEISFGTNLTFKKLIKNLLENKIPLFEKNLQDVLLKYMSFYDMDSIEKVYHSFVLGLMIHLEGKYNITSNGEGGFGRYDILIEPLNKGMRGFILEFKVAESEKLLEEKAKEGLKQIEDKKYYLALEKRGIKDITLLGMAFYKKFVKIESRDF